MPLLDSVQTGVSVKAPLITIHGPSGSRKTQMAVDAKALILQTEDGLGNRDAARFRITKLPDLYEVIKELATTDHPYTAVALDSLDHLVPLVANKVCEENGKASLEAFGYGKGAVAELDEWRKVIRGFLYLRDKKGISVILIAHQAVRSVNDPTQMEPYDRLEPKLPKGVNGLVKELSDVLGCVVQKMVLKTNDKDQTRAVGTGDFNLHLNQTPSMEAKNRYGIQATLPMTWSALSAAIAEKNK